MCNGMDHGWAYGQCGNLNTSQPVACIKCGELTLPYELHLGDCNVHYICQTGDHLSDHWKCWVDGHGYTCDNDGLDHHYCDDCGYQLCNTDPAVAHSTCALCGDTLCYDEVHELCSLCGSCILYEGDHGTAEGQCSYEPASGLTAASRSIVMPLQGFVAAELIIFLPFLRKRKHP